MRKHLILAVASGLFAGRAAAGVLDSPLPMLPGGKTSIAYTVSGVVNAAGLATFFSCTNQSPDSVSMTVELFVDGGGDPCNSGVAAQIVPSGGTVLFSTQNNVQSSFFSSSPLTVVDMFLAIGSARILTTGRGILCTSFVADVYNSPPSSIMALPMAARGKVK